MSHSINSKMEWILKKHVIEKEQILLRLTIKTFVSLYNLKDQSSCDIGVVTGHYFVSIMSEVTKRRHLVR